MPKKTKEVKVCESARCNQRRNKPDIFVNGVNKFVICCFRYITNFLYQKNVISFRNLKQNNITGTKVFMLHFSVFNAHFVFALSVVDFFATVAV